jgi:hypothetical protein
VAVQRIIKNAAATITHVWEVGEQVTDPTGTPTYTVVDANGTSVASGNATVPGDGSGRTTFSLAAQTLTRLLTVTWSATVGGVARVEVDQVEVVSGFFFSLAEGRGSDSSLADTSKYTTQQLLDKRSEVERECEQICDRAFLPRYARVVLDGTGASTIVLEHPGPERSVADVRAIRRISVAPQVDETFVDLTAGELADVALLDDGITLRRSSGNVFTGGWQNVVVEYEYGLSGPPDDLVTAALLRFRSRLNMTRSGIPDRATSFQSADGGTYRITLPDAWRTGLPEVDAAYSRYSRRARTGPNGGPVAASRTYSYQPQANSLFHRQGRR